MEETELETVVVPPAPAPIKVPEYGRKKVDEIIKLISDVAEASVRLETGAVRLHMSNDDILILADMLYEMDKHLPDFFEPEPEAEADVGNT